MTDAIYGSIVSSKVELDEEQAQERTHETGYKDVWAAVVFGLQLACTVVLAVNTISAPPRGALDLTKWLVFAGLVAVGVAILFLVALHSMARAFIIVANSLQVLVCICLVVVCFVRGYTLTAWVLVALCCLNVGWLFLVRGNIAYASLLLEHSSFIIGQYPSVVVLAFVGLLATLAYTAVWGFAVAAAYQLPKRHWLVPFLLFAFFWTTQVIQNVVHVTTAGLVAQWYFTPRSMPPNPTLSALHRAVTTSFGSICLGSLLVAVIKFVHSVVESLQKRRDTFVGACCAVVLRWLAGALVYFNFYAFTHVAVYGKSYRKAAADCWTLVNYSNISAVINDSLVGSAFVMVCVLGGVIVGAVMGLASGLASLCLLGGIVGIVTLGVVMSVVSSAVITIYVCYAEEPDALRLANLPLYQQISGVTEGSNSCTFSGM